jgi:DNA replicative helicase MCM subunit Mcm2 (Cdc46/Mcm family)
MSDRQQTEVTDVVSDWETFLKRQYNKRERVELAKEFPHKRSFYIDYRNLEAFGKRGLSLADQLIAKPEKVMGDVKDALVRLGVIEEKDRSSIHIRFTNLTRKTAIRDIRSNQINTFVSVEGILRKTTEVRPRVTSAVFKCLECGQITPPYPRRSTGSSRSPSASAPPARRRPRSNWCRKNPISWTPRSCGSRSRPRGFAAANSRRPSTWTSPTTSPAIPPPATG